MQEVKQIQTKDCLGNFSCEDPGKCELYEACLKQHMGEVVRRDCRDYY